MQKQFDLFAQDAHNIPLGKVHDKAHNAAQHDMVYNGVLPDDFRAQARTYTMMASQWVSCSETAQTVSGKTAMLEQAAKHTAMAAGILEAVERVERVKAYEDAQ